MEGKRQCRAGYLRTARKLLKPPCTERYARWCERTGANHSLLLDWGLCGADEKNKRVARPGEVDRAAFFCIDRRCGCRLFGMGHTGKARLLELGGIGAALLGGHRAQTDRVEVSICLRRCRVRCAGRQRDERGKSVVRPRLDSRQSNRLLRLRCAAVSGQQAQHDAHRHKTPAVWLHRRPPFCRCARHSRTPPIAASTAAAPPSSRGSGDRPVT